MKHACEKITQLTSDQLERVLSLHERLSMVFHFLICEACKHYNQNTLKLHQVLELYRHKKVSEMKLPEVARNRIYKSIQASFIQKD